MKERVDVLIVALHLPVPSMAKVVPCKVYRLYVYEINLLVSFLLHLPNLVTKVMGPVASYG